MTRYLLDVNVLLAIVWPHHVDHAAAVAWFAEFGHQAWASNPLTQIGVLRLLTNPAVTQSAMTADTALAAVAAATRNQGHEFWPLDFDIAAVLLPMAGKISGHQQWTDALLLSHAMRRHGVLVTFDSALKQLAAGGLENHLLVLKPR